MSREREGGKVVEFPDVAESACADHSEGCPIKEFAAKAAVAIFPCGRLQIEIHGIQPEYVRPIVQALDQIKSRLEAFAEEVADGPTAEVVMLKRRLPPVLKVACTLAVLAEFLPFFNESAPLRMLFFPVIA